MNTYKIIDKATWPRAAIFDSFRTFDDPCFNITVPLEAQKIYDYAKKTDTSFFLLILYAILRAANAVPQCKQRLLGDKIIEFDRIAVMTPILTEEELFQTICCEYTPTLQEFIAETRPKVEQAKQGRALLLDRPGEDFICASSNHWMHFSSFTQAHLTFEQTVPILAWGKLKNGIVPVGCKFNHLFVDGLHAGRFFQHIENSFASPEQLETHLILSG